MSNIENIKNFWNNNPCGCYSSDKKNKIEYFSEIERKRYKLEWHIPIVADFDGYKGKRVLEIGCGMGIDGSQFSKNGATYYGVDLTENAIGISKEFFSLFGYKGKFKIANAENLPFKDSEFDHVYSWGVIHHSPNTKNIISEIYRVLKPGGSLCVMVYNKNSINYYIEIMFLRKLFRYFLYSNLFTNLIVKLGFDKRKIYRQKEILESKKKISKNEWISMNTDGPECPLAKVYNKKEVLKLFDKFENVKTEVWFFNKYHWGPLKVLFFDKFCNFLGRRWGWHRIIFANK